MKKIFFSIVALAALAACTKSEVAYDAPVGEIGFAPTTKNITKAAMEAGALDTGVDLGVWAFWNYKDNALVGKGSKGDAIDQTDNPYTDYVAAYLDNATFTNRTGSNNWGGKDYAYPWPTNGSLVFAGYTIPKSGTGTLSGIDYTLNSPSDKMIFTYAQEVDANGVLSSFDLCWFGATNSSYNYRTAATNQGVSVTLSHALSWITFKAYGDGVTVDSTTPARSWKINSITLKQVNTKADAVCVGTTATWGGTTIDTPKNIVVSSNDYTLTGIPTTSGGIKDLDPIETTTANTLVIPQTPVLVEIEFSYPVGDHTIDTNWKTEKIDVKLNLEGTKNPEGNANTTISKWESGKHYTYTLYFKANEILIAPEYDNWIEENYSVAVE